ncbi:Uncharacterized protein dnm_000420 [Desulfonema magnum]|uniref:Uncharacterized protein n=1 Tax=Desulfonema magnum TaxID=45655 RepID=A0A975BEZ0_9BACT|nr:Uncharacterized protein dnm_000420 [Desulfonema magnum]
MAVTLRVGMQLGRFASRNRSPCGRQRISVEIKSYSEKILRKCQGKTNKHEQK